MPPFCAPSPPCLRSEPPVVSTLPERHVDDDRVQMIASLVTALSDAEAAASEQERVDGPEQQRLLAAQAYNSLCFDFPVVPTSALAALASSFRTSPLDLGIPIFPVTTRFTAGLRYLVSVELTKQSTLAGPPEATGDLVTEDDSKFRFHHLLELCGYVFLLAPALRLAVAHTDDGVSLHNFLAAFDHSTVDELEQDYTPEGAATAGAGLLKDLSNRDDASEVETEDQGSTIHCEVAVEMDDDDSDWEDLETFTPPSSVAVSVVPTFLSQGEKAGWPDLMGKLALLIRLVPHEVLNNCIWEELQLTDHLIQALNSIRLMESKGMEADVITTAKLYAELLADHLLLGWSSSSSEVTRVISALFDLVEAAGELKHRRLTMSKQPWEMLVLGLIAKLCSKIGGYPARKVSLNGACTEPLQQSARNGFQIDRCIPSATFVRSLWLSVFSKVQFLQVQLAQAQGPDSFSQLDAVFTILSFMVKCAPGNADLQSTLLEGGIFRSALQLYVKVGGDPKMEPLRHFLLLSMAFSPALAQFAAQVPSFTAAMPTPDLLMDGSSARTHAIIWPLLLRASYWQSTSASPAEHSCHLKSCEAENTIVGALNGIVEAVADNTITKSPHIFLRQLVWLHWLLILLEEAASVSTGSVFKLWQRGSPLDFKIGRCQVALGSLLFYDSQTASVSSSKPTGSEEKSEESVLKLSDRDLKHSRTDTEDESKDRSMGKSPAYDSQFLAVQEKLKELLPSMLLQLKLLSALTKGNHGAKID